MSKITEILEERESTRYFVNDFGIRESKVIKYKAFRKVKLPFQEVRMLNFVIDFLTRIGLFAIVVVVFRYLRMFTSDNIRYIFYIIWIAISISYFLILETSFSQSFGKLITRTIVVNEYGNKPSFKTIFLRTICRFVPLDLFSFYDNEVRGWHDKWSKTYVLKKKELNILKVCIQIDSISEIGSDDLNEI